MKKIIVWAIVIDNELAFNTINMPIIYKTRRQAIAHKKLSYRKGLTYKRAEIIIN